jgi:hypothetical protein
MGARAILMGTADEHCTGLTGHHAACGICKRIFVSCVGPNVSIALAAVLAIPVFAVAAAASAVTTGGPFTLSAARCKEIDAPHAVRMYSRNAADSNSICCARYFTTSPIETMPIS